MMTKDNFFIGLLFANLVDRRLLAQYLQELGYGVRELDVFSKDEWMSVSIIMVDEVYALKFSDDLLMIKQKSEPLFLPLVICILPNSDSTHWLKFGFDEVLQVPLLKAELASKLKALIRLRVQTETQFNLIYENIHIGIYKMSDSLQIIQANPAFLKILGFKTVSQVLNKTLLSLGFIFDSSRDDFLGKLKEEQKLLSYESMWRRADGTKLYLRENTILFQNKEKKIFYYGGTIEDITYQKQIEDDLKISEAKFRQLVDLSPYGILIESEGIILFLNQAMLKIFHAGNPKQIIGSKLLDRIPPEYHQTINQRLRLVKEKQQATSIIKEKLMDLNGNKIDVEILISPFTYEGKLATQVTINDISERLHFEKQIFHMAYHDQLTGLANRLKLKEELNKSILLAKDYGGNLAVIFIDLDYFKNINDSFGHDMGDLVLQEVAVKLEHCTRQTDTVARLGGDEFVVLLTNLNEASAEAYSVIKKIIASLSSPFDIQNNTFNITISLGISIYPNDGTTCSTLFKSADLAMYFAKQNGRNTYKFCTPELGLGLNEKIDREQELREAVINNEFLIYYQPKISFKTGQITGVEALLRWSHPTKGIIPPLKFITLAESTGLIDPIANMTLHQVCKQIQIWKKLKLPFFTVAINISIQNLQASDFVEIITAALEQYDIDPHLIELELTESLIMQNFDNVKKLAELKQLGIQISIDDFGTGYSSFNYLKKLNIDGLKIDKSFIRDLVIDTNCADIITMIIKMAHSMELKVIAEGVETPNQFQFLKVKKCDEMQGYYFCRPLPADEFTAFIKSEGV